VGAFLYHLASGLIIVSVAEMDINFGHENLEIQSMSKFEYTIDLLNCQNCEDITCCACLEYKNTIDVLYGAERIPKKRAMMMLGQCIGEPCVELIEFVQSLPEEEKP